MVMNWYVSVVPFANGFAKRLCERLCERLDGKGAAAKGFTKSGQGWSASAPQQATPSAKLSASSKRAVIPHTSMQNHNSMKNKYTYIYIYICIYIHIYIYIYTHI